MPTLSEFFGIIILMYLHDEGQHHIPHVHIKYNGQKAVLDFNGVVLAGSVPDKQLKQIKQWIKIHRKELQDNWIAATTTGNVKRINPLKRK